MICFKNRGRATLFFAFCIITILHYWLTYVYNCKKENFDSSASEESIENVASLYDKGLVELDNLVVTGKLTVGGEVICDGSGTFGNAKVGNWDKDSNYVSFSHKNRTGDNYGIIQNDKNTYVNSTADGNVFIRNNNVPKMSVSSNGIRFDKDELGIELKWISLSGHGSADTGYAIKDYVCTLADYRGDGDNGEFIKYKYFINKTTNDNWWVSVCKSYDSKTGKLDGCPPSDKGWRYVTVLAIPRILFSKINNQYYDDSK